MACQHTQRQHAVHRPGCEPTVQILSQRLVAFKFAEYKPMDYHMWGAMLKA